jgi:hypothetical protein
VAAQQVLVSTLAVTSAWLLGSVLSWADPVVAAILCVITLRISLQASVSEAFSQLIGVSIGAGLALLSGLITGQNLVTVALTVAFASAVARLLKLGDDGWINITVTALIVLGPGGTERNVGDRAWGTLLGVSVALFFAYWVHPSSPVGRTQNMISDVSGEIRDLLADVADGAGSGFNKEIASTWLKRARLLTDQVLSIRPQAEECVRYASWSPVASRAEAVSMHRKYVSVEHTMVQVRNIVRSFYDFSLQKNCIDDKVAGRMKEIIAGGSAAVESMSYSAIISAIPEENHLATESLRKKVSEATTIIRYGDDETLVLFASVLANIGRIVDSLDPLTPAIADVPTPIITLTPAGKIKSAFKSIRILKN